MRPERITYSAMKAITSVDTAIRQLQKYDLIKERYEEAIREYKMFPKHVINDKKK